MYRSQHGWYWTHKWGEWEGENAYALAAMLFPVRTEQLLRRQGPLLPEEGEEPPSTKVLQGDDRGSSIVVAKSQETLHCDTVYRPRGFVTCFLASSLWLVGKTAAAIQPRSWWGHIRTEMSLQSFLFYMDKVNFSPNRESILGHYGAPLGPAFNCIQCSFLFFFPLLLLSSSTKKALKERHGAVLWNLGDVRFAAPMSSSL